MYLIIRIDNDEIAIDEYIKRVFKLYKMDMLYADTGKKYIFLSTTKITSQDQLNMLSNLLMSDVVKAVNIVLSKEYLDSEDKALLKES